MIIIINFVVSSIIIR